MPKFDNIHLASDDVHNAGGVKHYLHLSALDFQDVGGVGTVAFSPAGVTSSSRIAESSASGATANLLCTFRLPRGSEIDNLYVFRQSSGSNLEAAKDVLALSRMGFVAGVNNRSVFLAENFDHTNDTAAMNTVVVGHTDLQTGDVPVLDSYHWYALQYSWVHNSTTDLQAGIFYGVVIEYTPALFLERT